MSTDIVLQIPHSSEIIPSCERAKLAISDEELKRELLYMTDRYTDELFDLGADAVPISYGYSRLVTDPERFPDNDKNKEPMVKKGMGAVYISTSNGDPLRRSLTDEEWQRLLQTYYWDHHGRLERSVREALDGNKQCLIIDAHSFPSSPLPCDRDQTPDRPDICIGTDPCHTPDRLQHAAVNAFRAEGWSVEVNRPYPGTMVPKDFLHKCDCVHSVMVEVNRALYMDEATGERSPQFGDVARKLQHALRTIIRRFREDHGRV